MSTTFTGANAIGAYRIEDDFNNGASGDYQPFGRGVAIDTFEGTNNGTELYEFCQRTPTSVVEGNFQGSWSVNFVLSTLDFLDIFDSNASGSPTDYKFDDPQSFEMVVHRKDSTAGTDGYTRIATGCIAQTLEFDAQVDGTVDVTMSGVYAGEKLEDSTDIESNYSQVDSNKDSIAFDDVTTIDFKGNSLKLPRGVTISLDNSMTLLSVLGDREAGEFTTGPLSGTVEFTQAVEVDDTATLESMYGSSSGTGDSVSDSNSMTITMENDSTASPGNVTVEWNLTGFTESYSESGIDVEEDFVSADVSETLNGSITATVTEP